MVLLLLNYYHMKNYSFLALYKGAVIEIFRVENRYFFVNSKNIKKELKKSDFIFIA